jgi:hypothetical protein
MTTETKPRFDVTYSDFWLAYIVYDRTAKYGEHLIVGTDNIYRSEVVKECERLNRGEGLEQYGLD